MGLLIAVEIISSVSHLVRFAAISLGPVSLVAALGSAQPMLVLLYAMVLAAAYPSNFGTWITRRTLRTQVTGIVAITAAVAIISVQ